MIFAVIWLILVAICSIGSLWIAIFGKNCVFEYDSALSISNQARKNKRLKKKLKKEKKKAIKKTKKLKKIGKYENINAPAKRKKKNGMSQQDERMTA